MKYEKAVWNQDDQWYCDLNFCAIETYCQQRENISRRKSRIIPMRTEQNFELNIPISISKKTSNKREN